MFPFDDPFKQPISVLAQHQTGSSYTVHPPVQDTDIDWLVLTGDDFNDAVEALTEAGWSICCGRDEDGKALYAEDEDYSETWYAFRKGVLNIMLTADKGWYFRAVAATLMCKHMNLKVKADRKHVFRVLRDGEDFDLNVLPTMG